MISNQSYSPLKQRLLLLLISLSFFSLCYLYTNHLAYRQDVTDSFLLFVDRQPIFLAWMIIPYSSSIACYCTVFILVKDVSGITRLFAKLSWAVSVASVAFILYPMKYHYPIPMVDNQWFALWFKVLHSIDQPYNQAPSLHVVFALIFYSELKLICKRVYVLYAVRVWLILIVLSTWFTYQHHSIDIILGLLLALIINKTITHSPHPIGLYYLMCSTACVFMSMSLVNESLWLVALLAYLALSLAATSLVYSFNRPVWLGKRAGKFSRKRCLLFAPYLIGYQVTWWINSQVLKHSNLPIKVAENLWLGARLDRKQLALLPKGTKIIDLTAELAASNKQIDQSSYHCIALLDLQTPTEEQLIYALHCLVNILEGNDKEKQVGRTIVYLHCAMGYSRCYLLACLYLVLEQQYTPQQARGYLCALNKRVKLPQSYISDKQILDLKAQYNRPEEKICE